MQQKNLDLAEDCVPTGISVQGGRDSSAELPAVGLPRIPEARVLWSRAMVVGWILLGVFLFNELTILLYDLWLLESLDLDSVFWTNFRMGAALFVIAFIVFAGAIAAPAIVYRIKSTSRRLMVQVSIFVGLIGGYLLSLQYLDYLLFLNGKPFGQRDPVFEQDLGFYVYTLPAMWTTWIAGVCIAIFMLASCVGCTYLARAQGEVGAGMSRITALLGTLARPYTLVALSILGIIAALGVRLSRYDLLWKDNYDQSYVFSGAAYVDVTGFFSSLNYYHVTTVIILGGTAVVIFILHTLHRAAVASSSFDWHRPLRNAGLVVLGLVALDFGFKALVTLRDLILVTPNQPVIQLEYIKSHIEATRAGYGLENVEEVSFVPNGPGDPVPDADELLQSATLRNVPLWPGYVSYLERFIDRQHAQRILQTAGDTVVYGPAIDILRQQQKLRMYYDFVDIDWVRYKINGETCMFISSVRELPQLAADPWLAAWGASTMLFTHGYGLVMAPVSGVTEEGEPRYASRGIPTRAVLPELQVRNQSVYYGEGSAQLVYTNVRWIKELDYPTDEGRAEIRLPSDVKAGVPIDSLLKRIVFGWRTGQFFEVVFSKLIGPETRVHYYRTPIERVERVAPFLYFDTNIYAVAADGGITWFINALTSTDRYPYSRHHWLGCKSDERSPFPRRLRRVNYVADAVKITVDAYAGGVRFYKISDEPIIESWATIYPGLFTPGETMPPSVREHLQYPKQLFHIQFDDVYKRYHMTDPMTFFNWEDLWDDADEVLGPILDRGGAITFSIEPYCWIAETGGLLPDSESDSQFALSMVFTPERAKNLRAIATAYQDGSDYGRLAVLKVPKGHFYPGPEQADAAMDQDPVISGQITWWNRRGAEVIHGHTSTLVIGREVIYVAPLFIRSQQNPVSQLKRVLVVFRGIARMGNTLEEALRRAVDAARMSKSDAEALAAIGEPGANPVAPGER